MKTSIIIPTLNAEKYIASLVKALETQTVKPDEIIIVDSESDDRTAEIISGLEGITFIPIKRKDFNHAKTRDMAFRKSTGDYVIFITQDAIPADKYFVERIIQPFSIDDKIAVSSGRQVPRENARPYEKLIRHFNYPPQGKIFSAQDIPEMGIKAFFTSDCCCAYRRDIFLELGGFVFSVRTAEDIIFSAKVINSGYKISYTAGAMVIHSHNLTLLQEYKRNFLTGYELEKHKDIFCGVS